MCAYITLNCYYRKYIIKKAIISNHFKQVTIKQNSRRCDESKIPKLCGNYHEC